MINFEDEIKLFEPSLEISQLEDAIIKSEMSDFNDIVMGMLKRQREQISKMQESGEDLVVSEEQDFSEGEYTGEEYDVDSYSQPVYNTADEE